MKTESHAESGKNMNKELRVLFTGKSDMNVALVCRSIADFGYDIIPDYDDSIEYMLEHFKRSHWDLLISLDGEPDIIMEEIAVIISELGTAVPWVVVCDKIKKDEIFHLLNAGCRDVIKIDELDRLELVIHRLLLETERDNRYKTTQEKIIAEKEKLELTLGSIGDGVIMADSNERIVMMNDGAEMITGWPSDLAINRPLPEVFKVVEKGTEKPLDNLLDLIMDSGEVIGLKRDTVLISRDGNVKYVSACISPIKVSDASIGVIIVFRDITRIRQTEEKLITEQRNLTLIFDAAPIGMLLVNDNAVIKKVNKSMLHIVGRQEQEVINQRIGDGLGCINSCRAESGCGSSDMCGKCELQRTLNEISRSRETMLGIETHYTLSINNNEKEFWLKINSVPVTIDNKKHVMLVIDDITKDKLVERELERSRNFYLTLFENFPALIWRSGLDGKRNYFNKSWLDFTGRALEQEMGDGWASGVHPEDFDYCLNTYIKAFNSHKEFDMEYRLRRYDGEYRWIVDMGRPFYDLNGDFSGYIGSCYDITERKTAEEGLRRYQLLSENANDIIMFSNKDGRIIEANSAALMSYGYTKEEMLSKSIFELVNPDNRSPVRTQSYKINAAGVYYEATARKKDGTAFSVEVSLQSTVISESKVLLSIQRDITERKQVQKELERAMEYAEAANLAKSEFLANMSHEIRTPLNGMLGMIDLTLLTGLIEEQKDNLFIAKGCASTLLNLINDILDFSRIEARKLTLEDIDFDFMELMEQTIKPHNIKAQGKGLKLIYQLDPQIPRLVNGDPNRFKQVINNLMGNAVKFTDTGEINLFSSLKNSIDDYVNLEFQISDTGVGIDSKDIGRIFDTFSQADNSITRKYGGSGLGLAISRQLVEMMGGTIWVESKKGKGSTFYFTVKLAVGKAMSSAKHNIEAIAKVKHPLKILLAEDDRINQVVITRMLKEAGHVVETVNNGVEALQVISEKNIDVVLMDIQMPEMDGIEAVKRVRKSEKGTARHIPIIALTAYALQGDREKYLSVGMDDYIAKPVQTNSLLETIEKVGERSKAKNRNKTFNGNEYSHNSDNLVHKDLMIEHSKNVEKIINDISMNMELLKDALKKKDLSLVEKYAHEIKQLSSLVSATAIKSAIFRVELAARRENITAAAEYFNYVITELAKYTRQFTD